MAKLHELLAVEADLFKTQTAMLADAQNTFAKKPDHFQGQVRSVNYLKEDRQNENTVDEKKLVTTVDERLDYALNHVGRYWDAVLQKEATNQEAVADLQFRGKTIATAVPATFLLGMEDRLKKLREVVAAIPTLNPSLDWTEDTSEGKGVFAAKAPTQMKTEKKLEFITVAQATDKHPAQVKEWTADVNVARIETEHTSGMWTPARKAQVLTNLDELSQEVKRARQRANLVEVKKVNAAAAMIEAILST